LQVTTDKTIAAVSRCGHPQGRLSGRLSLKKSSLLLNILDDKKLVHKYCLHGTNAFVVVFLFTGIYEKNLQRAKPVAYLENTTRSEAPQCRLGSYSITECLKEIFHDSYAREV